MKKILLAYMIAMTLFTAQAKAAWLVEYYEENSDHYSKVVSDISMGTFFISALLGYLSGGAEIFFEILLLDVNSSDGSTESKLKSGVPELQIRPEIASDLLAMARNGITQEVETSQGKAKISYIPSDVLSTYLAEAKLSTDSQQKLTKIFGLVPAQ